MSNTKIVSISFSVISASLNHKWIHFSVIIGVVSFVNTFQCDYNMVSVWNKTNRLKDILMMIVKRIHNEKQIVFRQDRFGANKYKVTTASGMLRQEPAWKSENQPLIRLWSFWLLFHLLLPLSVSFCSCFCSVLMDLIYVCFVVNCLLCTALRHASVWATFVLPRLRPIGLRVLPLYSSCLL